MLKNLINKFPNAIENIDHCKHSELFVWFEDHDGNRLGIPKSDITSEEINLLQALFPGEAVGDRNAAFPNKQWSDYLYKDNGEIPLTNWEKVRFIHFSISSEDFSYQEFEEAFLSFVPEDTILIWNNDFSGTLIEGVSHDNAEISELVPAINTLESDFYIRMKVFSGSFHLVDNRLHMHFQMEKNCFTHSALYLLEKKAISLPDVFPYLLMSGLPQEERDWYAEQLLGETLDDPELIHTVKIYIESNSNASSASKKLYIHRNSLQYRIDKFIEKTGLDIRTFQHALTAYLIILLNK